MFTHDITLNGVEVLVGSLLITNLLNFSSMFSGYQWFWTWWRHQMETFNALLALCAGYSPVTGEFSAQRPVTRNFDVFIEQRLNKPLRKQSRCRWFETPSRSLWRVTLVVFADGMTLFPMADRYLARYRDTTWLTMLDDITHYYGSPVIIHIRATIGPRLMSDHSEMHPPANKTGPRKWKEQRKGKLCEKHFLCYRFWI